MFERRVSVLALWVGVLNSFFSSLIFVTLAVYYVRVVGMNPLQLVLVGTVLEATIFVFEIPTGVLADAYSRRLSVVVGRVLVGVCFVIEGLAPLFVAVLAAEVIRGLGETFHSGAWEAWMADEVGEAHFGRLYARYQQVGYAGALAGLAAGVALAAVGLNLPPLIGGIGMMILGALMALTMPETRRPSGEGAPLGRGMWRQAWAAVQENAGATLRRGREWLRPGTGLAVLLAASFIMGGSSEGFDRLWEAHLLADFSFPILGNLDPVTWFGVINAGSMLVGWATAGWVARRVDLANPRWAARALLAASLLLAAAVAGFGLATGFSLALAAVWLRALALAAYHPIYAAWLNRHADGRVRATIFSMSGQSDALGQFAFGPALGGVGTRFSLRLAFLAAGALLLPLAGMLASHKGSVKPE